MNNLIYKKIKENISAGKKMLAVLLDPEKCIGENFEKTILELGKQQPDFIFVGGSTKSQTTDLLLSQLSEIDAPKILFPGDYSQFSKKADGLLLLSLLSGDNPDYLIGQHRKVAVAIKKTDVEVIPTGYILVDGGRESSVQKVSKTEPIGNDDIQKATSTAVAGELLGMKLIYLEAGSGALKTVTEDMILNVKQNLDIPLIVGGGIRTEEQLEQAYQNGADIVVVGNLFETNPEKITSFISLTNHFPTKK